MFLAHRLLFVSPIFAAVILARPAPAHACGGCFHEPTPNQTVSVVTDHRMAFSISPTQTTLWDQIKYEGDPKSFAWVLPVGQGAEISLARDEWLASLAAMTSPAIYAPPTNCYGNTGGGGMSCGCGGADNAAYEGEDGSAAADASNGGVQVISQGVVGPYDTVTLRSSSGDSISTWLVANGFVIQPQIQPILDAYTKEGFDFIALKLAPDKGVQAMQPVRVTTPGADPSLPLRMIAAGAGNDVGLELYVISDGRYETTNFPAFVIDPTAVVWDPNASTSNYTTLFQADVAKGGWVTEFSGPLPQLLQTYKAQCMGLPSATVPCATDAGSDASTDASTDASDDAATDADVSDAADASSAADASCTQNVPACTTFTDFEVATTGLNPYAVTITRLRTSLPSSALNVDLQIGAGPQTIVSNVIQTTTYSDSDVRPVRRGESVREARLGLRHGERALERRLDVHHRARTARARTTSRAASMTLRGGAVLGAAVVLVATAAHAGDIVVDSNATRSKGELAQLYVVSIGWAGSAAVFADALQYGDRPYASADFGVFLGILTAGAGAIIPVTVDAAFGRRPGAAQVVATSMVLGLGEAIALNEYFANRSVSSFHSYTKDAAWVFAGPAVGLVTGFVVDSLVRTTPGRALWVETTGLFGGVFIGSLVGAAQPGTFARESSRDVGLASAIGGFAGIATGIATSRWISPSSLRAYIVDAGFIGGAALPALACVGKCSAQGSFAAIAIGGGVGFTTALLSTAWLPREIRGTLPKIDPYVMPVVGGGVTFGVAGSL